MNNATKVVWILFTILIFLIGIWPLGIILIGSFIHQIRNPPKTNTDNISQKELDFYKAAAEVEHTLNREKDAENELYYK